MRPGRCLARWVIVAVIAACAAGAALALAGIATPVRAPLALAFLAVIPGLAVASLLPGIGLLARAVVAGASAIVINISVAEAMIMSGTWSTRTGVAAVGLISVLIAAARPLVAGRNGQHPAWVPWRAARGPRR